MRRREPRDNTVRAAMGWFIGRELFVNPKADSFGSRVAPTPGPVSRNHAALRNHGETVRLAGSSSQSNTRSGGAASIRCS
jgi:hypothetical protein